jgi:hypothetical protein
MNLKIEIDWGNVLIESVSLFIKGSMRWTGLPARKDDQGKYWSYIRFEHQDDKKAFDHAVFAEFDARIKKGTLLPEGPPDFSQEY